MRMLVVFTGVAIAALSLVENGLAQGCEGCVPSEPTTQDMEFIDRMMSPGLGGPDDFGQSVQQDSGGQIVPDSSGPDVWIERNPETGTGIIHMDYDTGSTDND